MRQADEAGPHVAAAKQRSRWLYTYCGAPLAWHGRLLQELLLEYIIVISIRKYPSKNFHQKISIRKYP